jgi:predicted permease
MGIRAALGASRGQLIRQLLLESVLLALLACLVGSLLAHGFGALLSRFTPSGDMPVRTDESWSGTVFLATALLAVVAGVLTGLVPALRATQPDVHTVLKSGANALFGSPRHRFRSALVIGQTALCAALLVCGGLFLESLRQMARMDLGFQPQHLVIASLDLGLQRYSEERGQQFYRQLADRLAAVPGVEAAAIGGQVPFDYGMRLNDVAAQETTGSATSTQEAFISAGFSQVSTGYFRAMGITFLKGRPFDHRDSSEAPRVVIINQTLARQLWGDQDPIGRRLRFGRGEDLREVVGVVRNGRYFMLNEEPRPFLFTPLAQQYSAPATVLLRTQGEPLGFLPAVRAVLSELDAALPLYNVRTMEEHLRQSALALMPLRMAAAVAAAQGLLGLGLAAMGLFGVVAQAVTQRTREIGIRIALGAQARDIMRLVMREGRNLTLIGLTLGLGLALLLALALSRLLYGLNPIHLPVFGGVTAVLAGTAFLACYFPARRALRVEPVVALRSD